MLTTRTGRHYPNPSYKEWRDRVVSELRETLKPTRETMITEPCHMTVYHVEGDLKRRDLTAMLDSMFHCMERAGLIEDDSLVKSIHWEYGGFDRKNAETQVKVEEMK